MEERHEIIPFSQNVPIKIFMHKLGNVPKHWHQSLELLFVLAGSVNIVVGDKRYLLEEEDVILINSNSVHELYSEECVLIAVQINLSNFDLPKEVSDHLHFECNSQIEGNRQAFHSIKSLIANLLRTNSTENDSGDLYSKSLAYALLSELIRNFRTERDTKEIATQKHLARLSRIMNFINEHYMEQLTLTQIAESEHLSVPYLSSFFEKYIGINFSSYYNQVRLNHAVNDLITSDDSIEAIALHHGFSDPRAFVRAFKKRYSILPSMYRKNNSLKLQETADNGHVNYLEFERHNYLHKLAQYLDTPHKSSDIILRSNRFVSAEPVNIEHSLSRLRNTFKTFTSVGRAKELLLAEVQEMLTTLQKEIGYEYIKFHGLLSDDMLVCRVDEKGKLFFSFVLIDKVIDFLLSIGLKPLIQFSFMPEAIASDLGKTIFSSKFNTSPPKQMEHWNSLVAALTNHLLERYGRHVVREWLFCVWNEPDTSSRMFGFGDDQAFYELYQGTFNTVKACDPKLTFGSPSLLMIIDEHVTWAERFFSWAKAHNCMPEFINLHYYADDFAGLGSAFTTYQGKLSEDSNRFQHFIAQVRAFANSFGMSESKIFMTEWNLTLSHRNLINDTCFKSCYLTKNLLENYDQLDSFGYWTLTDLLEETQPDEDLFHGGLGLFTYNGIKKPHYYAFQYINRLGDDLLTRGTGYFVTKSKRGIQMICYNYEHFNHLFASGEVFDMTQTNRYTVFTNRDRLEITIPLTHIPNQKFVIKEYIINQNHGSSFDKWVEMGAINLTNSHDVDLLKQASVPMLQISQGEISGSELTYTAILEPLEVRFIEIILNDVPNVCDPEL